MTKTEYKAAGDGFILGRFYKKGDPVLLTDTQAKYLAPPYGRDVVVPAQPKPDKKDK